jgi:hypothetical protein
MFNISVLSVSLLSQGLITVEIFKYLLHFLRYDKKCDENALLEKNFKVVFSTYFVSNCQTVIPHKVSGIKKAKNVLVIFLLSDQETCFYIIITQVH